LRHVNDLRCETLSFFYGRVWRRYLHDARREGFTLCTDAPILILLPLMSFPFSRYMFRKLVPLRNRGDRIRTQTYNPDCRFIRSDSAACLLFLPYLLYPPALLLTAVVRSHPSFPSTYYARASLPQCPPPGSRAAR